MPDHTALRDALRDLVADIEADDALRDRIEQRSQSHRVRPTWRIVAAILAIVAVSATAFFVARDDEKTLPVITKPSDEKKPTVTTVEGRRDRCDTTKLEATWIPEGWSPDPEDQPQDEVFIRSWGGADGRISAFTGVLGRPTTDMDDFSVFEGVHASVGVSDAQIVGEIECDVYFETRGISKDELRAFMMGLVYDDSGQGYGWLWPEVTVRQAALSSQHLDDPDYAWRDDALKTAVHFVHDMLGWTSITAESGASTTEGVIHVTDGTRSADVSVVRAIAGRWWSVTRVWTFGNQDPGGSATFNADGASAGLDYHGDFATSEVRFWRGDRSASVTGTEAGGSVAFDPPWPTNATGALLLTLKDGAGNVVHAWGTTIPTGDFAAG